MPVVTPIVCGGFVQNVWVWPRITGQEVGGGGVVATVPLRTETELVVFDFEQNTQH